MTRTTVDLVAEVLLELSIIAADETPSAEQSTVVTRRYTIIQQELENKGYGAWDIAAIPDTIYLPLVEYVAARCQKLFGVDYDDPNSCLRRLDRSLQKPYIGKPLEISVL